MFYFWLIILIVFLILMVIAIPYLLKETENFLNYSPEVKDFGRFPFTNEEWKYIYQQEFIEDEKGKDFFDQYFNIIFYGHNLRENATREIFFTSQEIYLTDNKKGKSFVVNRLNYFGNGFKLSSMNLLFLSPLNKLKVKIDVIGANPESGQGDFSVEYLVPIPQSSLSKIDEILKSYGKIILDS